jgi:putative tryptophan/tyrosine transport system substrate-binding protein
VRAQPSKVRQVGALLLGNADAESFRTELRDGLRKLGYVEGQNINFDFRSAEGNINLLPKLAAELVALRVDVIVAVYTPCALSAQQTTREIPIVVVSGDPVGTGLATSLNHPGGNITGVSLMAAELHGKCVELFRDMLPSVRRVAVLLKGLIESLNRPGGNVTGMAGVTAELAGKSVEVIRELLPSAHRVVALANAPDPFSKPFLEHIRLGGVATGTTIDAKMIRSAEELEAAFSEMEKERPDAVIVQPSLPSKRSAELALR